MLGLAEYRASRCPCGCGHPARDTTAPEGTYRWIVPPPTRCRARDALSAAQAVEYQRPEALLWHAVRG